MESVPTKGEENWMKVQGNFLSNPPNVSITVESDTRRLSVKNSLQIPGTVTTDDDLDNPQNEKVQERRLSIMSTRSSYSHSVDYSRLQDTEAAQNTEDDIDEQHPKSIANNQNYLSTTLPYLPVWLAAVCLLTNIVLPGTGNILGGVSVLCCGEPRVQSKDDHIMMTVCVNFLVGISQLFTVTFLLVGWFWGLSTGILTLVLAVEYRRQKQELSKKKAQAKVITNVFGDHVRPFTVG